MKSAVASLFFLISLSVNIEAAFTDFEDLVENTRYSFGSTVSSGGLSLDVIAFPDPPGFVAVSRGPSFSPLETTVLGTLRAALDFVLPQNTNHISLDFGTGGDPAGMIINGVSTPLALTFDSLYGTTVGGVLISRTTPRSPLWADRLVLTGEIESFVIGGIELGIDNVAIFVPEPATAALLLVGVCGIALKRRV